VYTPADGVADVKLDSSKVVPEWAGPFPLLLDVVLLFAARGRGHDSAFGDARADETASAKPRMVEERMSPGPLQHVRTGCLTYNHWMNDKGSHSCLFRNDA
jgi:hypothetical protein